MKLKLPAIKLISAVMITSLIIAGSLSFANAQEATTDNAETGLLFSPPIIELTLEKGQSYPELIKLQNTGAKTQTFYPRAMDFLPRGEEGGQEFIESVDDQNSAYSMALWMQYPKEPITLDPGERAAVNLIINVPENAEPGGKYAALLFSTKAPDLQDTSGVGIITVTGPIILGTIAGPSDETLTVAEFKSDKSFYEYLPAQFTTRLQNQGNVHLKPIGKIEITNMLGKNSATLAVNETLGNILPNSVRLFNSIWEKSGLRFGKYTATLLISYGTGNKTVSNVISFWVFPWKVFLAILLAIIIVIMLLRMGLKRYNKMIIKKALEQQNKTSMDLENQSQENANK